VIGAALAMLGRIPWQAWLLAAIIAVAVGYHRHAVNASYDRGAADYRAKIEAANKAAGEAADKGEAAVRACLPPRRWNREAGRCEQ
jgi:hypothetical protein